MTHYPEVWERTQDHPAGQPGKTDRLLNVNQVKEKMNCSRSHVYNLMKMGYLAVIQVGTGQGGKRVYESEVDRLLSHDPDADPGSEEKERG